MGLMGLWAGPLLIVLVTVVAMALAKQAARSVAQFREEHHERFIRRDTE